jgi:hypothetical protein
MDNTILQQGRFTTANTSAQIINIRSDIDWIRTMNLTQIAAAGVGNVVSYWQRGMPTGQGLSYTNAGGWAQFAAGAGFTLINTSVSTPTAPITITATTSSPTPLVTTTTTAGLSVGSIVRLSGVVTATQLNGVDFQVSAINSGTTFTIRGPFAAAMVAGTATATAGYQIIPFDPYYYPRRRFIVAITQATSALVTTSVDHGYTVGQEVRFNVDPLNGMTQINGLMGTILTVPSTSTFTVNIDSSAFTAFTFPVTANPGAYTPAQVVPFGEDTAAALVAVPAVNILADATINTAFKGIQLAYGAGGAGPAAVGGPAGVNGDVIYWVAGQSFSVINL